MVQELNKGYVSTILRLHCPTGISRLELALFSLCGQRHRAIEPIVVLQNFGDRDEQAVRLLAQRLPWADEVRGPLVINVTNLPEGDHRARLMNIGIDSSTGEFLAFLDYDDYLYPNAYEVLLTRLERKGIAAAIGGTILAKMDPESAGGYVNKKRPFSIRRHKLGFFHRNLYPIHSIVLKRQYVGGHRAVEGMSALEDYLFLLKVFRYADWDDELLETPVCEYVYWADGRNTVPHLLPPAEQPARWANAEAEIGRWKERNHASVSLSRLGELGRHFLESPPEEWSAQLLHAFRYLVLAIGTIKRTEGSFTEVIAEGHAVSVTGCLRGRVRAPARVAVFAERPRSVIPSLTFLGLLNPQPTTGLDAISSVFRGRLDLPRKVRKMANVRLAAYVISGGGKLRRVSGTAALPSQGSSRPAVV
jgi:hypothetical protein